MSTSTEREIEYLRGQRLGRLATTSSSGAPHIVPVGFRLGGPGGEERFGGGGWDSVWFSIVPERIISWGIEAPAFSQGGRSARSVADR